MDRLSSLNEYRELAKHYEELLKLHGVLDAAMLEKYQRSLPFSELIFDRWERAKKLGFGEGSSVYDSALIFGQPRVGSQCWIGPFTILDGSGNLEIGNHCTISAGVHIYTHDNIRATLLPEKYSVERKPVKIGNCCYIAPNSIITKGVEIGDQTVVAANSMVNKSFGHLKILAGNPAKEIGEIQINDGKVYFKYY